MLAKLSSCRHLEMSCFFLFNKDNFLALIKKSFFFVFFLFLFCFVFFFEAQEAPLAFAFVGRGCRQNTPVNCKIDVVE